MKKKALAFVLSTALCLSAALPAFAANENQPAQPASPAEAEQVQHEYQSFQVFTGTEKTLNGQRVLIDVQWGAAASDAVIQAIWDQIHADGFEVKDDNNKVIVALKDTDGKYIATANDIARAIDENYNDSTTLGVDSEKLAKVIADAIGADAQGVSVEDNTTFTQATGWYLVVDKTPSLYGDYSMYKDRSQLKFIFENDTFRVTTKRSWTEIFKEVEDINDSVTVVNPDGTTADYDIGDPVPFKLTATLPDNVKDYDSYTFMINDRQDKGFDFPENFVITVDGNTLDVSQYNITPADYDNDGENNDFDIDFGDVASNAIYGSKSKIVVTYTSVLNEKAKTGNVGNENTSRITYNPNNEGEGHTPWDIVIVFTYSPLITKVDQSNQALEGAVFDLVKVKATVKTGDDGKEKYTVLKDDNGKDQTVYTKTFIANGNEHSIKGIDDGVYKIVESTTPDGYNTIDPIYFVVVATHDFEHRLISLDIYDLDGNSMDPAAAVSNAMQTSIEEGTIHTTVINQKGVVLPSTGGIGTTIFYIIGGVLVVGAVVLLVVRRKMRTEEE